MAGREIPELDGPGLRKFALTTSAMVVVLFGGLIPWLLNLNWPMWPWIVGAVLSVWGLAAPATLNPVYRTWMKFGLIMGAISSRIILFVIFFLMFMPMGLVMRLCGKDPLHKVPEKSLDTYRKTRGDYDPKSMEKPF